MSTALSEFTGTPRLDRIESPSPALTATYSSAPTIPTTSPTASFAAITRSRLGVTTNVEFAVPWRYSFVDSSAPSVNMNTIARCVPMMSVATLRLRRSETSPSDVVRPAASPSMRIIAPSSAHVVRTETSFSHSDFRMFIARTSLRARRRRSSSDGARSTHVALLAGELEEAVLERRDLVRELEDRDAVVGGERPDLLERDAVDEHRVRAPVDGDPRALVLEQLAQVLGARRAHERGPPVALDELG